MSATARRRSAPVVAWAPACFAAAAEDFRRYRNPDDNLGLAENTDPALDPLLGRACFVSLGYRLE